MRDIIRAVRPDAIMVELDESRLSPSAAPGVASQEPTSLWEILRREALRTDAPILDRIRSAEVAAPAPRGRGRPLIASEDPPRDCRVRPPRSAAIIAVIAVIAEIPAA